MTNTTKSFNFILNIFRGEDNEMALETVPMNEFQWLTQFMEGQKFEQEVQLSEVLEQAEEWFKDEVEGHTEEDAVVLKQHYDNFVKQVTELLEEDEMEEVKGVAIMCGGWGVEYDNNFGVMIHMYEGVELEVVEEEQE